MQSISTLDQDNLNRVGVLEINEEELAAIDGGLLIALGVIAAGLAVGIAYEYFAHN